MTDHENFPLTDYQRANLAKLANYLDSVEPPKFDMRWFNDNIHNRGPSGNPNVCGTVACAVGYVPVLDTHASLRSFLSGDPEETPRDLVEGILNDAEGEGMNPGVKREGVVYKSNSTEFSFKAISNSYLLHKG